MDRVIRKYFVKFEELSVPVGMLLEDERLVGIRFQKTELVGGRVRALEGSEFDVRAPMIISSIGSIPRPIDGVPTKGELYHYDSWETGEVHGLPGVFGLGNVLTGKGNIKDSRANAIEIIEKVVAAYLGVGDSPEEAPDLPSADAEALAERAVSGVPMSAEAMRRLAAKIEERHEAIGYEDYSGWIQASA
jgi:hypothetical protein